MSLILKGIDLPKEGEMHLIISKNGIVCGAEYPCKIKHAYPLNLEAQAIQIPKGHGRIGDLDELQKAIRTDIMGGLNYEWFIEATPTILEAEE